MRLKAIKPGRRSRPITGIPLEMLRVAVAMADQVAWVNAGEQREFIPADHIRHRLRLMPPGSVVVVMVGTSRGKRQYPVDTSIRHEPGGTTAIIQTNYIETRPEEGP